MKTIIIRIVTEDYIRIVTEGYIRTVTENYTRIAAEAYTRVVTEGYIRIVTEDYISIQDPHQRRGFDVTLYGLTVRQKSSYYITVCSCLKCIRYSTRRLQGRSVEEEEEDEDREEGEPSEGRNRKNAETLPTDVALLSARSAQLSPPHLLCARRPVAAAAAARRTPAARLPSRAAPVRAPVVLGT